MASTQCVVRPYAPSDRDAFLSLYESVWGHAKRPDWFDWRFRANPYRDGVQMVVAADDDELVGAEPMLPFRLHIGSTTVDAYQPVDWIVHPDYRRRGIFSRMTERLLAYCADDATLLFNFPNDALLPGLSKFGWRVVGELPTSYRVQNPRTLFLETVEPDPTSAVTPLLTAATTLTKRGLELLDRLNDRPHDIAVERKAGVAVDGIHGLYNSNPPTRIHVPRDEPFLRWRFANPNWKTRSYIATRRGTAVATVVTATERTPDCTVTMLLDYQPMDTPPSEATDALFARIIRDNRDADVLKMLGDFAPRLRRRHGFYNDTTVSRSRLPTVSTAAVRPLAPADGLDSAEPWSIDGLRLTDPENWLLTLADLDIE